MVRCITLQLIPFIFLTLSSIASGATFNNQRVTTSGPPSSGCVVPPAATSFLTSDAKIYLYFEATTTLTDQLTNDWLAPDGTVIKDIGWNSVAGTYCYTGGSLAISNLPATRLGQWQARVFDNGTLLFSLPFSVSAPSGQVITTVAGGGWRAFTRSSIPAMSAPLGTPFGEALDGQGNLYVVDSYNNIVVRVSPTGTLVVVAGNSNAGFSGDGGAATSASLNFPAGLAVDSSGNLYIADANNNRIRKVSSGIITTIAGTGVAAFSGDGGPAANAALNNPSAVALDSSGNLYIVDRFNFRVREVSGGIIRTVAGTGVGGFSGDGGPATSAMLSNTQGITLDALGNLYIADYGNNRIRVVSNGNISTVAGNGTAGFSGDGGPATAASIYEPQSVAVDSTGQLFITDFGNDRVRKVSVGTSRIITTVAGNGLIGFSGDGSSATAASFAGTAYVVVDSGGQLFISDFYNGRVRKVSGGTVTTIAGIGGGTIFGDGGPAISAGLLYTDDVAVDANGNLYIADSSNNVIRKVSGGVITTVAGTGTAGFSGDGGPASSAAMNLPLGIAVDAAGNLYIADTDNNRIRKVSGGTIATVAGTGSTGSTGDNGRATSATLTYPYGVAVDSAGNIYIADTGNNRIRKVSNGTITTVAGTGVSGSNGDGGPAINATFNNPQRVAVDAIGNLYISDTGNHRIRKVSNGTITTVAGTGTPGYSGDFGPASSAALDQPMGIAVDGAGNLLIADSLNERIRMVSNGTISTVVGNGFNAFAGDGGPATRASLTDPWSVAIDGGGNIYVADTYAYRVRKVLNTLPSYQVSPNSLTYSASAGGSAPTAQTITLSSSVPSLGFTTTASASWINVTPSSGSIPTSLQVTVDPSTLTAGTYQGTITISAPNATPPTSSVAISFTVQTAIPTKLSVGTQNLSFTTPQGSAAQTASLQISNVGGGSLGFTAVPTTASGGSWLSLSQTSGTATSQSAASLTVTATPGSLSPGTYQGTIAITNAGTTIPVAVTLSISNPTASILLSQSGLSFNAVTQGGTPLPQTFGILNTGQGSMNWSASASTTSGGSNWLKISPTSGTVTTPFIDVSMVNVSIDPTGLVAGTYYGQIQVTASAVNSPQVLTVVLTVLPAGTTPGPDVRPSGLIFTGTAGVSPGSQDVMIGNPKPQMDNYLSANIGKGFSYLPTSANIPSNQPSTLRVFPDFSQLPPGDIERGTITMQFSDGTPRNVTVLVVVAPSATSSGKVGVRDSGSCSKPTLEITMRSPMQGFSAVLGQPTTLEVQVVDDCGNLVGPTNPKNATVSATFSNKDADLKLTHIGNGIWTGTWRPVNSSSAPVNIAVTAFNSTGSALQSGQRTVSGNLTAGNTPTLTAGGVVHAASAAGGVPIAPGSLITIYGSNLADVTGQASTLPLPQMQNGTQVWMGNQALPILYTSSGQLNVQVPFNTPVDTQYQISVQRDNSLSVPEQLVVAAAQPGVFAVNQQGNGQGVIFKSDGVTLAQPGTPATAGETVVIYCTGLGAVNPPVPEGTPPPSSPLSTTVNTVTVSIGGNDAPVQFSGLTPGFPGLYQVNAVVPAGMSGDAIPLVVSVAGQTSPPVTLAIQ
jgi:uncharacterized protein (TIGR03437 family)